jgi:hypothetical protein
MANALLSAGDMTTYSLDRVMPWIICLLDAGGEKDECLGVASRFGPGEEITMAAWTLLCVRLLFAYPLTWRERLYAKIK